MNSTEEKKHSVMITTDLRRSRLTQRRAATEEFELLRENQLARVTATPETEVSSPWDFLLWLIALAVVPDWLQSSRLHTAVVGGHRLLCTDRHLGQRLSSWWRLGVMFDCVEALGVGARPLFDVSAQSSCMLRKARSFFPALEPFSWSNNTRLQCKCDEFLNSFQLHVF